MGREGFWDNSEAAADVVAQLKALKVVIDPVEKVFATAEDLAVLRELAESEDDQDSREEVDQGLVELSGEMDRVELLVLLSSPCLFPICAIQLLNAKAHPLEVTQVHPQQHQSPVAAFCAAGSGVN